MGGLVRIGTILRPLRMRNKEELREKEIDRIDESILNIIASIDIKNNTKTCHPKIKTIIKLMKQYYAVERKQRTIEYHLRKLEAKGYIMVRPQCRRRKNGTYAGKPSLYIMTRKMIRYCGGKIKQSIIWITKMPRLFTDTFNELKFDTVDFAKKQMQLYYQQHTNGGKNIEAKGKYYGRIQNLLNNL